VYPPHPQLISLRQLLAHRAIAQAGADEGTAEKSLGAGHIDAGEAVQGDGIIDKNRIQVSVGAQL
jgi:hypothetical protein